jgi:hypothetical protein
MRLKRLLFNTFCILSLLPAYSQNKITHRFGLTSGLSASQIVTPSIKDATGLLWDYTVGISVEQRFSSKFALAYELKYARQGGNAKVSGLGGSDVNVSEFRYLLLPVMGQFRPNGERIFIEAGGQIGYFLSGRNYFASKKEQAFNLQNMTKLDAGLIGGLGYQLSKHFVIDARYYYGMRTIREDARVPDPITGVSTLIRFVPQYNRVWSLNMRYYF